AALGFLATNLLIKTTGLLRPKTLSLGAAKTTFAVAPMFNSIGRAPSPAATAPGTWYRLTAQSNEAEPNPWDLCHDLLHRGLGIAGVATPEFAEPDLQQRWIVGDDAKVSAALTGNCEQAEPQDPRFPRDVAHPYWFRDADHAQFDAALNAIGGADFSSKKRM